MMSAVEGAVLLAAGEIGLVAVAWFLSKSAVFVWLLRLESFVYRMERGP